MKKIKVLIVDDEPLARQSIRPLIEADAETEIVGEAVNGLEALDKIRRESPDLVFLDVQMPEMDGFEVIERLTASAGIKNLPMVIFVTAYDAYAIQAFEVNALDYLLKPFSDERFEKTLERAKKQLGQQHIDDLGQKLISLVENQGSRAAEPAAETAYITRFLIKTVGRINFIKTDEIDWIEAADYYARLYVGKKSYLIRESMNELEKQLDPQKFSRVHRSSIVNLDQIKEMFPHSNGDYLIILKDGTEVKLSRSRREHFLDHKRIF